MDRRIQDFIDDTQLIQEAFEVQGQNPAQADRRGVADRGRLSLD
jgi:hypothetical protein